MRYYIDVSLPLRLGKDYLTYHFDSEDSPPAPGCRVIVPLINRFLVGYVLKSHDKAPDFPTSPIYRVLDPLPLLPPQLIDLGLWIANTCICSPGEAFHCMLPAGLKQQIVRFVIPGINGTTTNADESLEECKWLAEQGRTQLKSFLASFPKAARHLSDWVNRGLIRIEHELSRSAGPRLTTFLVPVNDKPLPLDSLTPKERQAVECLLRVNVPLNAAQLAKQAQVSSSVIRNLVKKGVIETRQERIFRQVDNTLRGPAGMAEPVTLSDEQEKALSAIKETAHGDRRPVLLHGVTCSGKTEIYLRWVADEIAQGRGAIVLVPEIALTPQMVARFRSRFGNKVAILHSRLSDGERFDQWELIRRGSCPVVVGARSAIFAPVPRLGTIILDEEGEASFKQDESPRYHAREVALQRCRIEGALLIMGSATPTIDSYHLAKQGVYRLIELKHRVANRTPPLVKVVDMRHELVTRHNRSMFSEALSQALRRTLENRKQAILFLNRRGYSSFVFCRACGQPVECSRCQVSLVYHSGAKILRCHYCGEVRSVPNVCPTCGSSAIKYFGAGTQRIEAEARRYFPKARIARIDSDTTVAKGSLEEILNRFGAGEIDILIGTQMVAKGLDFPGVTLVGIMAADSVLRLPDFRAAERNFALLSQVSGRAGRGSEPGTVILQTYAPEHHSIRYALNEDYTGFYNEELPHRKDARFPPFLQLASLLFTSQDAEKCKAVANCFRERISTSGLIEPIDLLGPAPAPIPKINSQYRFQILLRHENRNNLIAAIRTAMESPIPSSVKLSIDLDPYFAL